jgi:hypothetical protein
MFDAFILSLYLILGLFIILGYVYSIRKESQSDLWTNKGTNFLTNRPKLVYGYLFMITLSFLSGIYLIYYLSTVEKTLPEEILITLGSIFLLFFSVVWAWYPFYYPKWILFMVALGSMMILIGISLQFNNSLLNILAITAAIILFIQTFFFDFLLWSSIIKF